MMWTDGMAAQTPPSTIFTGWTMDGAIVGQQCVNFIHWNFKCNLRRVQKTVWLSLNNKSVEMEKRFFPYIANWIADDSNDEIWLCFASLRAYIGVKCWTLLKCFSMLNIVLTYSHCTCLRCPCFVAIAQTQVAWNKSRPHRRIAVHLIADGHAYAPLAVELLIALMIIIPIYTLIDVPIRAPLNESRCKDTAFTSFNGWLLSVFIHQCSFRFI